MKFGCEVVKRFDRRVDGSVPVSSVGLVEGGVDVRCASLFYPFYSLVEATAEVFAQTHH